MDKKIIEKKGINAVSEYICDCGFMEDHLATNDKTLLWDGDISVYKQKDVLTTDTFRYNVKCQVKASEWSRDFFPPKTGYEIKLRDLQKYLTDGGVVFFKSLVARNRQSKVYCAVLTKLSLKKILDSATGLKYTKIDLLPTPDAEDFLRQIESLYLQATHTLITPEHLKDKEFSLRLHSPYLSKTDNIFSLLSTTYNNFLVTIEGIPGEFLLEAPTRLQIGKIFNHSITINEREFFGSAFVEFVENGIKVSIGKSTVLIFPHKFGTDGGMVSISYNFSASSISEAEKELTFLIEAFEHGHFCIDKLRVSIGAFDPNIIKEQVEGWQGMLSFVNDVKKLFNALGVVDDLDFNVLTQPEVESLEKIIYSFLYDGVLDIDADHDRKDDFLEVINAAGISLFLFFKRLPDGGYKILDIHRFFDYSFRTSSGKIAKQPVLSVLLEREDQLPSNLGVDIALEEYKELIKVDSSLIPMVNHDIDRLLYHYDTFGKEVHLAIAFSILDILINCNFSDNEVNIYTRLLAIQIYKRRNNSLLDCHKEFLYELEADIKKPLNRFTAAVLLDDKSKADWMLKKIDKVVLEQLPKLPIYTLYKKLQ